MGYVYIGVISLRTKSPDPPSRVYKGLSADLSPAELAAHSDVPRGGCLPWVGLCTRLVFEA